MPYSGRKKYIKPPPLFFRCCFAPPSVRNLQGLEFSLLLFTVSSPDVSQVLPILSNFSQFRSVLVKLSQLFTQVIQEKTRELLDLRKVGKTTPNILGGKTEGASFVPRLPLSQERKLKFLFQSNPHCEGNCGD